MAQAASFLQMAGIEPYKGLKLSGRLVMADLLYQAQKSRRKFKHTAKSLIVHWNET
jgi:hypothetical protein